MTTICFAMLCFAQATQQDAQTAADYSTQQYNLSVDTYDVEVGFADEQEARNGSYDVEYNDVYLPNNCYVANTDIEDLLSDTDTAVAGSRTYTVYNPYGAAYKDRRQRCQDTWDNYYFVEWYIGEAQFYAGNFDLAVAAYDKSTIWANSATQQSLTIGALASLAEGDLDECLALLEE